MADYTLKCGCGHSHAYGQDCAAFDCPCQVWHETLTAATEYSRRLILSRNPCQEASRA